MTMGIDERTMRLEISGIGIVFHSPRFAEHISEEEDYLESNYTTEEQVQSHIQKGTIVGFGTGTSGTFVLRFHTGYPDRQFLEDCDFKWV